MLEATKRPALRLLHRSRGGEALLVRLYLEAERHAERAAPWEPLLVSAPRWLGWLDRHRDEERGHAGFSPGACARSAETTPAPAAAALMSSAAGSCGRSPADRGLRSSLRGGALVPALAVAWRMEEMGVRVFARHAEVLAQRPRCGVAARVARGAGGRAPPRARLPRGAGSGGGRRRAGGAGALVARIDRIERRLGVTGAVLLIWGGWLWCRQLASFISPSPTGAAT